MKDKFYQSNEEQPIVKVYENMNGDIFIGNVSDHLHDFEHVAITFTPEEAILFAKYVLKIAKELKQ